MNEFYPVSGVVQAVKYTGLPDNVKELCEWTKGQFMVFDADGFPMVLLNVGQSFCISVETGTYVVKDSSENFRLMTEAEFEDTYSKLITPDTPPVKQDLETLAATLGITYPFPKPPVEDAYTRLMPQKPTAPINQQSTKSDLTRLWGRYTNVIYDQQDIS